MSNWHPMYVLFLEWWDKQGTDFPGDDFFYSFLDCAAPGHLEERKDYFFQCFLAGVEANETEKASQVDKQVVYAAGYKEGKDSYGMFDGPTPDLHSLLTRAVPEDKGKAYIIRFNLDGTNNSIYVWSPAETRWRTITGIGK